MTEPAPIKISGELTPDPSMCHFHVSQLVVDEWTLVFNSAEEGKHSPLIDALFAVEGVSRVLVAGSTVTVTKSVPTPWPHLAAEIAAAIRSSLSSGAPAIHPSVIEDLKNRPPEEIELAIAELLEEQINPALASHGGFVHLVKVEDRDVYLEMGGGCQGCAASKATMRYGVESAIRRVAPQVRQVIDVTDHAAGVNPYFK
jgi:Fe-S cluster biogenesis protein NfuA